MERGKVAYIHKFLTCVLVALPRACYGPFSGMALSFEVGVLLRLPLPGTVLLASALARSSSRHFCSLLKGSSIFIVR